MYQGRRFTDYAVLGDDVVITDSAVAGIYAQTLSRLRVTISYSKSLISDVGAVEFAKRFRIDGLTKDLSLYSKPYEFSSSLFTYCSP